MNVNSVNTLASSYLFPLNSTATNATSANSASSVQQQADVLSLPPDSQFFTQLQQLQTQNPQEFQAMLTEITGQPDQAAGTAPGNASTAQQPQQAGATGHHGGNHCSGSSSSSAGNAVQATNASTQNENLGARIFGSISPIPQQTPPSIWA